MKKILTILSLFCSAFALTAGPSLEEAYDLYAPNGNSTHIGIWISGEIGSNRISLAKGKNPLRVPDEKGELLQADPSGCETKYCFLGFHGGEANRAFNLHGSVGVAKNKWTRIVVTFVPRKTGKVRFSMGGGGGRKHYPDKSLYKYANLVFRRFAGLTCENTKFNDPKFTKAKPWNTSTWWHFRAIKAEVITDPECPEKRCFRALNTLSQVIPVTADKMVTIIFYYRSDDCFDAKM